MDVICHCFFGCNYDKSKTKISLHTFVVNKVLKMNSKQTITPDEYKSMVKTKMEAKPYTWKAQWFEIGGKRKYYRSKWEKNYALYLQWMLERGEIASWEHECKTFWFEEIKRGTRSYLPDFEVTLKDGRIEYHEVKGWYDPKSLTKIKRMDKYYPEVKLRLVDAEWFKNNNKFLKSIIPHWD